MSDRNPSSSGMGGGSGSGSGPGAGPKSAPKTMLCEEWEALLVDALDGKLAANESAAFAAHRDTCTACAQLLEDAKRGSDWLHFLETEPEVPRDLVERILAQTSGATDKLPAPAPSFGTPAMPGGMPVAAGWTGGWLPAIEQRAPQYRWMMTAAMAFFSIAFTINFMLNQTGVKLSNIRAANLKPTTIATGLKNEFYLADKNVMRYYDNLRFVYEVESRVRELRQASQPQTGGTTTPQKNPASTTPGTTAPSKAKPNDGSAERSVPAPAPQRMGEPTEARFDQSVRGQPAKVSPIHCRVRKDEKQRKCLRAERNLA